LQWQVRFNGIKILHESSEKEVGIGGDKLQSVGQVATAIISVPKAPFTLEIHFKIKLSKFFLLK